MDINWKKPLHNSIIINNQNFMSITRRTFTKVAGLATVGTIISSKSVWASNSNTLKIGLIGCGDLGTGPA